jgi:hypothetical protein
MTMRLRTSFVLLATFTGCGLGKSMTEDQFCQEYAKRECAKVAAYCSFSATSCEPLRLTACHQMADASKSATRQYNADSAGKCLDQVNATYGTLPITADKLQALDRACSRVFSGGAKAAAACTIDFDCEKDLICDKGHCGAAKVVGSGAGCANIGETCPKGQSCTNTGGLFMCTAKQAMGAACSATQPCVEELRCTGTCVARADNAAVCMDDDECKSGYCNAYVAPGSPRKCGLGLSFSDGSPSCAFYMGMTPSGSDAGTSD